MLRKSRAADYEALWRYRHGHSINNVLMSRVESRKPIARRRAREQTVKRIERLNRILTVAVIVEAFVLLILL